jgi:TetR/AcrR family transcriptional regulator, regulator of biofilm formation and stress response
MEISAGEQKRQQILDAVLQTISKEGVDSVTHRRVGQEAGVSHGVVSYHFPTRDELIYKAFEHHLGTVDDYQEQKGWQPNERMTKKRLLSNITDIVAEELAGKTVTKVEQELILYATRKPELAKLYNTWEQTVVDSLAISLKQLHYKQPQHFARILVSLVRGFLLESLTNPSLTEKEFKQRVNMLLNSFPMHGDKKTEK